MDSIPIQSRSLREEAPLTSAVVGHEEANAPAFADLLLGFMGEQVRPQTRGFGAPRRDAPWASFASLALGASFACERADVSAPRPPKESPSSPQPPTTGTRNAPSATQAHASSAGTAGQSQGEAPAALSQAHAGNEPQQPESQSELNHETPSQPQPQSQPESQQVTQEAHAAREIARSDARPIASDIADIEGHAPREAAHLSSPPALNRFEVVEQIARAARAPLRAGHTELTVRLESWGAGAAA